MIIAQKTSALKRHYAFVDANERTLAEIKIGTISGNATLNHEGYEYRFEHAGLLSKEYFMFKGEEMIGKAELESRMRSDYALTLDRRLLRLIRPGMWSRRFVVLAKEHEQGYIDSVSTFSSDVVVSLPPDWPLPFQAFIFWLVTNQWQQSQAAS